MKLQNVLLKPLITEKSTLLQESGKYVFQVAPKANKIMIKQSVELAFGVKVVDVNIAWNHGKAKRYGPRFSRASNIKKAVVTLRAGDKIQLVEGL